MKVIAPKHISEAAIELPASKSISNRLLIIQAISGEGKISGLSDADDTRILYDVLQSDGDVIDVGHAGTAYRFLTAFYAISTKEVILTGSDRMKKRPIGPLVEALKALGADISYLEEEGFPPLKINGKELEGGAVKLPGFISSQFISALMLIAPKMSKGLWIEVEGDMVSRPYIEMTAALMRECCIEVRVDSQKIYVSNGNYSVGEKIVEKDWSAASFWYQMVLLGKLSKLELMGLTYESIQGDAYVKNLFEEFGVKSVFSAEGVTLEFEEAKYSVEKDFDFTHVPDLTQPFVVSMAGINNSVKVIGIDHLKIKETDRLNALKCELEKLGAKVEVFENGLSLKYGTTRGGDIDTYEDHRMAMSFAPLALVHGEMEIENPDVVSKSYPNYWQQLAKLGFTFK